MRTETAFLFFVVWSNYLVTRTSASKPKEHRRSPLCAHVTAKSEKGFSHEKTPGKHYEDVLNCTLPNSMAQLRVDKKHSKIRVTINSCPNVTQLVVRVTGPAQFHKMAVNSKGRTVSCHKNRDMVIVSHPPRRQKLWLIHSRVPAKKDIGLTWSYQFKSTQGDLRWSQERTTLMQMPGWNLRNKRATAVNEEETKIVKLPPLQGCGKKNSCIRFGTKGCTHLECDYLLSYSITNHTFLQLEISGKTDGWIALGLSSDNKMGGDGVIVCKLKSALSSELVAMSMSMAAPYTKPSPRETNDIKLVDHKVQGEHIYCKITKDLLTDDVQSSSTGLDLTNNWYQFYAKGKIDLRGVMLKHTKTPPTSLDTISMLRPQNVESLSYKQLSSNSATLAWLSSYYLLILFVSVFFINTAVGITI